MLCSNAAWKKANHLTALLLTASIFALLFFGRNVTTAIKVAQARDITILALAQQGLSITEYTPSEVKLAVTGYGAARKEQVGFMVCQLLHLQVVPKPDDAADAAAIAICHAHMLHPNTVNVLK